SQREQPIGFNVLGRAHSEEARERTVDSTLHIFKEIWAAFWGPRSDSVLRAALSTLVHAKAADSSAYTLCEVVPLLTHPAFRRMVLTRTSLSEPLRGFWQRYDAMSE